MDRIIVDNERKNIKPSLENSNQEEYKNKNKNRINSCRIKESNRELYAKPSIVLEDIETTLKDPDSCISSFLNISPYISYLSGAVKIFIGVNIFISGNPLVAVGTLLFAAGSILLGFLVRQYHRKLKLCVGSVYNLF